jgi:hypothetical protein
MNAARMSSLRLASTRINDEVPVVLWNRRILSHLIHFQCVAQIQAEFGFDEAAWARLKLEV